MATKAGRVQGYLSPAQNGYLAGTLSNCSEPEVLGGFRHLKGVSMRAPCCCACFASSGAGLEHFIPKVDNHFPFPCRAASCSALNWTSPRIPIPYREVPKGGCWSQVWHRVPLYAVSCCSLHAP